MPIGKLEPFDLSSKQWPAYIRRVKQFIILNEIKDELKVPMLITVVGEATYTLMCDLCSPDLPEAKPFEDLVRLVTEHLEPQRSEIAERHVFRLRRQRAGEPLVEYLQDLKHLASTCNFASNLQENLRDQFVSGLASEAMRSRIFAEKSIQYKEAVELALALEAADRHAEVSGNTRVATSSGGGGGGEAGEGLHHASARRGAGGAGGGGGYRVRRPSAGNTGGGDGGEAAGPRPQCWRCGKPHHAMRCRYKQFNCDLCNQRGHLKAMCREVRDSGRQSGGRQNYLSDESEEDMFQVLVSEQGNKPYFVSVSIDGLEIKCEIDTGSRVSAISEDFYKKAFPNKIIKTDGLILRSYSGARIESLGYISVNVTLGDVSAKDLPLQIIRNGSRPLLGREWMRALQIQQINLNEMTEDGFVNQLCKEFPDVFSHKLGTCKQEIRLQITDSEPVYVRARPVPLALKARVERELARLENDGSIYRVDHSDYGTPIVPVIKDNGEVRICGDYKITVNPKLKRDFYPLPRIEELFACLSGGDKFSKIDLKHAYEQCLLSEDSQPYTAITTHVGNFVYRRTPYGLSCIPEKFQKLMEETLRGLSGAVVFLDDICVTGPNHKVHMSNLRAVLERLKNMGLTVKLSKCSFLQDSVKYLGYIIDKNGLRPDPAKVEAISSAPQPKDITQLKSFLGMLNYYGKFIPNLSSLLHPLHNLLRKEVHWKWDPACEKAFTEAKRALLSERVLAHYDEGRAVVLSVDSSAYGVGAVLSHRYEDGSERPVSCVSRTLNAAEVNYSQLDKEALAIYFGITKHHQYLFGRRFTLRTDHQPLAYIFGAKGGIPQTAASRLQRWAARLAAYDFTTEFVRSENNGPADALSRLPLAQQGRVVVAVNSYMNVVEESLPMDFRDVARETKRDQLLSKIYGYILFGWPSVSKCEDEKPYFSRKQDLVVDMDCIVYKYRIVIPPNLRSHVLNEIHEGHLGMNKMKNLSRSYVYWPNLDRDIEELCRACEACRAVRDAPPRAQLHPWEYPLNPWQRLHADFADCGGKKYLIVVDANSKWVEAITMNGTDTNSTIRVLRDIFARFGLPSQLVTDNGPPFSAHDFNTFCIKNCIRHTTTAPYRPQGNGAAENAVKTIKKCIKRALHEGEDVAVALSKFLLQYRNSPHATTGVSPAEALLGRRLRGRLDALRPDRARTVHRQQQRQRDAAGGAVERPLQLGDTVMTRDYSVRGGKWAEGKLVQQTGPVSYRVDMGRGVEWRRHADQIIPTSRNRYSLTRASTSKVASDIEVDKDAEETFEDASDGVGGVAQAGSTAAPDEQVSRSSRTTSPVTSPPVAPALPADASARALRAYKRAKRAFP